jgi:hypothetical protein
LNYIVQGDAMFSLLYHVIDVMTTVKNKREKENSWTEVSR